MYEIKAPNRISATIVLPSSKSISNRALVINALAGNHELPENVSDCDDTKVMIKWMATQLHQGGTPQSDTADSSCGYPVPTGGGGPIDIGPAGTAMRFSTALLAVTEGTHIITGSERMKNRPIAILVDALRELGAEVDYVEKEGYPPLKITGNPHLEGGKLSLPGNVSSQYISALLMIGPTLKQGLTLTLTDNIVSRPYINLTLQLINDFGGKAGWADERTIEVAPQPYSHRHYFVESDWSGASYWYEIVALSNDAEIVLPGLFKKSYQGDSKVAEIFDKLGVKTEFIDSFSDTMCKEGVRLTKSGKVCKRLDYDFVNQPDLAQTFVVTCCMMGVPFHFTGLQSLKIKETDRIEALKTELRKLGYVLQDRNDSELIWEGEKTEPLPDASIDTYEDHRMAMAFAPCALRLPSIMINNPQVVSKSYPHYWEDLKTAGFLFMTAKKI